MSFKFNPFTGTFDIDTQGGSGGPNFSNPSEIELEAAETISALKVIYSDDGRAKLYNPSIELKPIGLSLNGASAGQTVVVKMFGEVQDSFLGFDVGEILFSNNFGSLTNLAPTSGYYCEIGSVVSENKVKINILDIIEL